MELKVNGNTEQVESPATLDRLLAAKAITLETSGVAVAVNNAVVPRAKWSQTPLGEGDTIEIIYAVQGG